MSKVREFAIQEGFPDDSKVSSADRSRKILDRRLKTLDSIENLPKNVSMQNVKDLLTKIDGRKENLLNFYCKMDWENQMAQIVYYEGWPKSTECQEKKKVQDYLKSLKAGPETEVTQKVKELVIKMDEAMKKVVNSEILIEQILQNEQKILENFDLLLEESMKELDVQISDRISEYFQTVQGKDVDLGKFLQTLNSSAFFCVSSRDTC
jgi:hypothetical protein